MPDSTPTDSNEEPKKDSIDLTALQSFSFGTQWTAASKSSSDSGKPRFNKGAPRGGDRPDRRPGGEGPARKDRRPPRAPRAEEAPAVAPRERGGPGDQQQGRRPQRQGGRPEGHRVPFQPYQSEVFDICFYPEDNCFSAIIKAMRGNHLTYELFQVAKLFMEKSDRFIASVTRKATEGQKPEKVYICAIDSMPFATEEEVIAHAMAHHSAEFFTVEEVEVEPPTGNFAYVNRCPFTKELLGPPNYHKYEGELRKHHLTRLPHMSFEKVQSSIETVRDEEVVAAWLESQKKATRFTAKDAEEGAEPKIFLSAEAAMNHLRGDAKPKVVKQVNYARVGGNVLEKYPDSEAFKAMDGERQRQQRFPLDTANAIRGRMRREKFSIFKKGAKGVTFVCATKRNFRSPGQVMSPDLDRIIRFLEANQLTKAKEFPVLFATWLASEGLESSADEKKVVRDLHWLIADGYVSHFEDDSLFAQPVLDSGNAKAAKPATAKTPPMAGEPAAKTEESAPEPAAEGSTEAEKIADQPESIENPVEAVAGTVEAVGIAKEDSPEAASQSSDAKAEVTEEAPHVPADQEEASESEKA